MYGEVEQVVCLWEFRVIHNLKTGALLYKTDSSTKFLVLGLIHVQIDIAVCEREMQLLGIAHCLCDMPKWYKLVVVRSHDDGCGGWILWFNLLTFISYPSMVDLFHA